MPWLRMSLLLLILASDCATGQPAQPKLSAHQATNFTISLPQGWAVETASENGDQVVFSNPNLSGAFVAVFTFKATDSGDRWPNLEDRWQFAGRNPGHFKGGDGRDGITAEGPRQSDPTKQ